VARPTDRLDEVVRFYSVGLGLSVLESFEDHEGFDGTMLGHPGAPYHRLPGLVQNASYP
jgi:YycE-like protein